jgi:hypothetical protein
MSRASIIGMGIIKWKLAELLEANNLTAYRLATTLDSHTRAPTIYRIAKKDVELSRVDFTVLATVIDGLRELTGKDVSVSDLLEYQGEE